MINFGILGQLNLHLFLSCFIIVTLKNKISVDHCDRSSDMLRRSVLQASASQLPLGPHMRVAPGVPPTLCDFETDVSDNRKLTIRDAWALMITAVPRVGPEAATAVLQQYDTPKKLWLAYKACIQEAIRRNADAVAAAQSMLAKIPMGSRTLGSATAKSIYDNLFANGWNLSPA